MSNLDSAQARALEAEGVFAAWLARVEDGEPLNFDDLLAEHAVLASDLVRLHEDWKLFAPILGKAVPGLIASESGLVIPSITGGSNAHDDALSPSLLARLGIHTPNEGRYRFRAVIGRGGGGVVLKVWDTKLSRPLAMKVVLGRGEDRPTGDTPVVDGRTLSRFVDEARIASQLNHPGIVPVHELGADETGRAFFTMKLVRGEDLSRIFEHVRDGTGGWNLQRALNVLLRVCEAMEYAHAKQVIHRDLKPANVMVGTYGEVHVMDWGLARVIGGTKTTDVEVAQPQASVIDSIRGADRERTPGSPLLTIEGAVVGTPSYMSPEQARGELDAVGPATDVYAVGAMLYELIAGETPYVPRGARVDARTILMAVIHGPPKPIEALAQTAPVELVAICEKSMSRDIRTRYPTMGSLADDLRAFVEGRVVAAFEAGTWAESKKWVRRNKSLAGSIAATLMASLVGLVTSIVFRSRAEHRYDETRASLYSTAIAGAQLALRDNESTNLREALDAAPVELRSWEWGFLHAQSDTSVLRCSAAVTSGRVTDGPGQFAICPNGTRVASVDARGSVDIWNVRKSAHERTLLLNDVSGSPAADTPSGCVAFTPDSLYAGTVCRGRGGSVWRLDTGERVVQLDFPPPTECLFCAFSKDGSQLLVIADEQLSVFDRNSGHRKFTAQCSEGVLCRAEFSHDGSMVISGSGGDLARVWSSIDGHVEFDLHESSPTPLAIFSPDDSQIVTCSWRGAALWSGKDGHFISRLDASGTTVSCAAFSPDGQRVVTSCSNGCVHVWDCKTHLLVGALVGHSSGVTSVAYSPDGSSILTTSEDGTARAWGASSFMENAVLRGHGGQHLTYASFCLDSIHLLTAGAEGEIHVWDLNATRTWRGSHRQRMADDQCPRAVFSHDGTRIAVANGPVVEISNAFDGALLLQLVGHSSDIVDLEYRGDDRLMVTTSYDGTVRSWDALVGTQEASFQLPQSYACSVDYNAEGTQVLTASSDGVVRIWDCGSGTCVRTVPSEGARCAAFSPDSLTIAAAGSSLQVFRTVDAVLAWKSSEARGIRRVRFSGNGAHIICGAADERVYEWNTSTGRQEHVFVGHTGEVWDACFSPDGSRAASASVDGSVRLWDVVTGGELLRLDGHTDEGASDDTVEAVASLKGISRLRGPSWLSSVGFSDDGSRLLTAGMDQSVRIYDSVPARERWQRGQVGSAGAVVAADRISSALRRTGRLNDCAQALRMSANQIIPPREEANALSTYAESCRARAEMLRLNQGRLGWYRRLLGVEPWPREDEVARQLASDPTFLSDGYALNNLAWKLVDPDRECWGEEIKALVMARMAVADGSASDWAAHDTLARALYRVGRFSDAIREQELALTKCAPTLTAEYEARLHRLKEDIAQWQDEQGELRRSEVSSMIKDLEQKCGQLEQDDRVKVWAHSNER